MRYYLDFGVNCIHDAWLMNVLDDGYFHVQDRVTKVIYVSFPFYKTGNSVFFSPLHPYDYEF